MTNDDDKSIGLSIRAEGKVADEGKLDLYDAAQLLNGTARVLNIVAHAFANNDEVRHRGDSARGVQTFVNASQKGCFEEIVELRFAQKVVNSIGKSAFTDLFWDYLETCISTAVGVDRTPTMDKNIKRISSAETSPLDEVAHALESPLVSIHQAIKTRNADFIVIGRPRMGDVLTLDATTLDYVTVQETTSDTEMITGNVTRFNVLTKYGRLYSDRDSRIVSFKLRNVDDARVAHLAIWSMNEKNNGGDAKVNLQVTKCVTSSGHVVRYFVHDISKVNAK